MNVTHVMTSQIKVYVTILTNVCGMAKDALKVKFEEIHVVE